MNFLFWEKGGEDAVAENGAEGGSKNEVSRVNMGEKGRGCGPWGNGLKGILVVGKGDRRR